MESKIKTVEDAFAYTGRDIAVLEHFKQFPEKDRAYLEASYKRVVVIEALNKEDNGGKEWTPDFANTNERKYYSWVWLEPNTHGSGFVVGGASFDWTDTDTHTDVGSRLCLRSSELVQYINKQFADLIQIVMAE